MAAKDSPAVTRRRKRLQDWIDRRHGGVQASFVASTKINQGELSGLLHTKSFGEKRARSLEAAAKMPPNYLDSDENGAPVATEPADDPRPVRLDPDLVKAVVRNLRVVFRRDLHQAYNIEKRPDLFVEMYEQYLSESDPGGRYWLGRKVEALAQQGAPRNDVQSRHATPGHRKKKIGTAGSKA